MSSALWDTSTARTWNTLKSLLSQRSYVLFTIPMKASQMFWNILNSTGCLHLGDCYAKLWTELSDFFLEKSHNQEENFHLTVGHIWVSFKEAGEVVSRNIVKIECGTSWRQLRLIWELISESSRLPGKTKLSEACSSKKDIQVDKHYSYKPVVNLLFVAKVEAVSSNSGNT